MIMRIDEGKGIRIISLLPCWASYCFPQCQLPCTCEKNWGSYSAHGGGGGGGGGAKCKTITKHPGPSQKIMDHQGSHTHSFQVARCIGIEAQKCPVQSSIIPSAP